MRKLFDLLSNVSILFAAVGALTSMVSATAHAHSFGQKAAGYTDNQGLTRQRMTSALGIDPKSGGYIVPTFDLNYTHDTYRVDDLESKDNKYIREVYGSDERTNKAVTASTTQTWDKLFETRQMASGSSDGVVKSNSYGLGASQWFFHESLRWSLDLSRTFVSQPYYPILDYDSVAVANPEGVTSSGATLGMRHLATPTTIVDYTYGQVYVNNRPATHVGSVAVRQFIPAIDTAVHVSAIRAVNRGRIDTNTTYGQVDAWTEEISFLKALWHGALAKVGYRRYVEDETTRAYEDKLVLGSDTLNAGYSQEISTGSGSAKGTPLTLDVNVSRYRNNNNVAAKAIEGGVSAKF